jgi:hypothetical protein
MQRPNDTNPLTRMIMGEMEEIIPIRWNCVDGVWFTIGANGNLIQHEDRETVLAMYHLTKETTYANPV